MPDATANTESRITNLPWHRAWIPRAAVPILGALIGTVRARWVGREHLEAGRKMGGGQAIYSFWHENLLQFAWSHRGRGYQVMSSWHPDGELMARALQALGYNSSRGSTTRGGAGALRDMARAAASGRSLALTPDGPKGPRRVAQQGAVALAAMTGLPVIPAAVAYEHCYRLGSWDRMAIPRPFTRAAVLMGEPMVVDRDTSRLEEFRKKLEDHMCEVAERVEAECMQLYKAGEKLRRFDPRN